MGIRNPLKSCLVLLCALFVHVAAANDTHATVRAFVDAFNAKDIDAMLAVAHEDIQWLYVSGDSTHTEASGRAQLRESMLGYFKNYPDTRSEIIALHGNGDYVQAIEKALWKDADGLQKSQCSASVYELAGDKVLRVWYYPEQPCDK